MKPQKVLTNYGRRFSSSEQKFKNLKNFEKPLHAGKIQKHNLFYPPPIVRAFGLPFSEGRTPCSAAMRRTSSREINGPPRTFPESPSTVISNSAAVAFQKVSGDQPSIFGFVAIRYNDLR